MSIDHAHELIVCGWDEVFTLALHSPTPQKTWSWRAADRPELPESYRRQAFASTDECKPLDGGRRLLITSSSGGVAIVERATGVASFYAYVPMAHSADLLPNARMVVAGSGWYGDPDGNSLCIFDTHTPERLLQQYEYPAAHGVVWDAERELLWALGDDKLRTYRLQDWASDAPSLVLVETYLLPEGHGHDLAPVPNSPDLSLSTGGHCWLFDRDARRLRFHPILADTKDIKCIAPHPATDQLAYIQAESPNWWAEHIHFQNPACDLCLPGEHLYKVRWNY